MFSTVIMEVTGDIFLLSMFGLNVLMVSFCDVLWLIVGTNNFQGVLSITLLYNILLCMFSEALPIP